MSEKAGQFVSLEKKHSIPKMGTSGVRQVQEIYNQPFYLEQFIQGIADHLNGLEEALIKEKGGLVLLGGDPRLGNADRIRKAAEIFVGNGFTVKCADRNGVASTPAMSHAIRHENALAGVIFTASHNPYTDVGIKVNIHDGSPALEDTAKSIHTCQNADALNGYYKVDEAKARGEGLISDLDTVDLYADLLDSIFDFADMRQKIASLKLKGALDGMGGATGPYITEIFGNRLGLDADFLRCEPDLYLGGAADPAHPNHPEPDFPYIEELISRNKTGNYHITAAYDSDGDRRLDGGSSFWVESADEFAIFARFADLIKIRELFQNPDGSPGRIYVARSAVTAPAADLIADDIRQYFEKGGNEVYFLQTATGFKWIAEYGNWGVEESNGLGNPYLREKDGIFSTIFLLKVMLETGKSPRELMEDVWKIGGRYYFTRGEISNAPKTSPVDQEAYEEEIRSLEKEKVQLTEILYKIVTDSDTLAGMKFGGMRFERSASWDYVDPAGNVREKNAAYEVEFEGGNIVKLRFSGTSSGGYTLRVYITAFDKRYDIPKKEVVLRTKTAIRELLADYGFTVAPSKFNDEQQPDAYAN